MFKLNVGFTKKIGEPNYGSRGASVNFEVELEPDCLESAERLKDRLRRLFVEAKAAVQEELATGEQRNGHAPLQPSVRPRDRTRPATAAQLRALTAIADRWQVDLAEWLFERFGTGDPAELSITEASGLIDELKGKGGGAGVHR